MMGNRLTDVVKHLLIINVILFFATQMIQGGWGYRLALHFPTSEDFMPLQLISHMFMHANTSHLFFNMFGLFIFGPIVENRIGSPHFFKMYFVAGFGAMILQLAIVYFTATSAGYAADQIQYSMVGASGALFGVVIAFATLFPNMQVMLLIPPIPLKAKYMALLYIGIDLYMGLSGRESNVAHFAHLGGALFGYLYIRFFTRDNFRIN